MKTLYLQKENVYTLAKLIENIYTVALALVGEDGKVLKDKDGNDLRFSNADPQPAGTQLLTFDLTSDRYTATFEFAADVPRQYARAYWQATLDTDDSIVDLSLYYPEELVLENSVQATDYDQLLVPTQYFIDGYIGAHSSLSPDLVGVVAEIMSKNPQIFQDRLLAAQSDLEREIRVKFTRQQFSIKRDLYQQEFWSEYWLQQVNWYPLVSVDSFKLMYGNQEISLSNELKDSIVVDHELGTMEFVPIYVTGNLFTLIVQTVSAIGITLVANNERSRVPALFRIDYTAGLDFPNLDSATKASIRQAVSRRGFINIMPHIDQLMREANISQSIDGASLSRGSGLSKIIEDLKKDDAIFITGMQKEFGTSISMAIS